MAVTAKPVVTREKLLAVLAEQCEQSALDYKRSLNLGKGNARDIVELAKDVAAMQAEPNGGYIVIGADDQGSPVRDLTSELAKHFDDATLRQKLAKYLAEPKVLSAQHSVDGNIVVLLYVYPSDFGWCIFREPGEYEELVNGKSRKQTVFRVGDVFVRHGTRSERWTDADRVRLVDQMVERRKDVWRRELTQEFAAQLDLVFAAGSFRALPGGATAAEGAGGLDDTDEYFDGGQLLGRQGPSFDSRSAPPIQKTRNSVSLPFWTGDIPALADCYQAREATCQLAGAASRGSTTILCQVLSGLGGVGKTQLAANFAWQMWNEREVDLLVWVAASSRANIVETYADAVRDLTGRDEGDVERDARRFRRWLAHTDHRWLVVLDDVVRSGDLRDLWPPESANGITIITTRSRDDSIVTHGQLIDVDVFTPDEAHTYLSEKLAGKPTLADDLANLAEDLGYLPLALAQAVTYITDRNLKVSEYRSRFASTCIRLRDLAPEQGSLPDQHRTTLAATWTMSVEFADRELSPRGLSRPLLALASVMEPTGIPVSLFTTEAARAFVTDHRIVDDGPISADDARDGLYCLHRLNLIHIDSGIEASGIRIHPLVQRATSDIYAASGGLGAIVRAAADALLQIWPIIDSGSLGQRLRANAITLATVHAEALCNSDAGCHEVLFRAGNSLGNTGLAAEAARYYRELHQMGVRVLGVRHPHTLVARAKFASWTGRSGDFAEAIATFEDLLPDLNSALGPNHPDTFAARASLASYRGKSGDFAGAAAAFEELLAERQRLAVNEDRATLTIRARLGTWQARWLDDPALAVRAFEDLLADRIRVLGPEDPDTLITQASLAAWRGRAGDPAGAVIKLEEHLSKFSEVFGADHPITLTTRASLAFYRGKAGDVTGAIAAFEDLFADRLRILGPDHPHTLASRSALVHLRADTIDAAKAAEEAQRLLLDQVRVFGVNHPWTLRTRTEGVFALGTKIRSSGVVSTLETFLAAQISAVGSDHFETIVTRAQIASASNQPDQLRAVTRQLRGLFADHLAVLGAENPLALGVLATQASCFAQIGDFKAAAITTKTLLRQQRQQQGRDHPDISKTLASLAYYCQRAGKKSDADRAHDVLVAHQERTLGRYHHKTLSARASRAQWRGRTGDAAFAAKEMQRLLSHRLRILGPDHPDTLNTRFELAHWRRAAGDHRGAVSALKGLLSAQRQYLDPDHPDIMKTRALLDKWQHTLSASGGTRVLSGR